MSVAAIELQSKSGGAHDLFEELHQDALLRDINVLQIREGGLIDCWVPMGLINREEVPVKAEHVDSLAEQMSQLAEENRGSGQLVPITLGLIEGEDSLRIIDGFHRDAALKKNGEKSIYATIIQTDWDELFNLRIFTAKDHVHVRFSRVVQWIGEVWQHSGLADKLSVEQAVLMYRFNGDGSKLGLEERDATAAKAWVALKEKQWDMPAMTIHSHLKVAENVDPKLVHSTREKRTSHALEAPTQAILKIFSDVLPKNFEFQNLVMEAAKAHNLRGPDVKALCLSIKFCPDLETAQDQMSAIDWDNWEPVYGETKKRALRRGFDLRYKGAAALDATTKVITNVIDRVDLSLERREEITPEMAENITEAQLRVTVLLVELGRLGTKLSELLTLVPTEDQQQAPEDTTEKDPVVRLRLIAGRKSEHVLEETEETVSPPTLDEEPAAEVLIEKNIPAVIEPVTSREPRLDIKQTHGRINSKKNRKRARRSAQNVRSIASEPSVKPAFEEPRPIVSEVKEKVEPSENIEPAARKMDVADLPDHELAQRFMQGVSDYLTGQSKTVPSIRTRLDIARAEQVLEKGIFRSKARVEAIETAIDAASEAISDRSDRRGRRLRY